MNFSQYTSLSFFFLLRVDPSRLFLTSLPDTYGRSLLYVWRYYEYIFHLSDLFWLSVSRSVHYPPCLLLTAPAKFIDFLKNAEWYKAVLYFFEVLFQRSHKMVELCVLQPRNINVRAQDHAHTSAPKGARNVLQQKEPSKWSGTSASTYGKGDE